MKASIPIVASLQGILAIKPEGLVYLELLLCHFTAELGCDGRVCSLWKLSHGPCWMKLLVALFCEMPSAQPSLDRVFGFGGMWACRCYQTLGERFYLELRRMNLLFKRVTWGEREREAG